MAGQESPRFPELKVPFRTPYWLPALASREDLTDEALCQVCFNGESDDSNPILYCDGCDLTVHTMCYYPETSATKLTYIPKMDSWYCDACVHRLRFNMENSKNPEEMHIHCICCGHPDGALREVAYSSETPVVDDKKRPCFIHMLCAMFIAGTQVKLLLPRSDLPALAPEHRLGRYLYILPNDIESMRRQAKDQPCSLCQNDSLRRFGPIARAASLPRHPYMDQKSHFHRDFPHGIVTFCTGETLVNNLSRIFPQWGQAVQSVLRRLRESDISGELSPEHFTQLFRRRLHCTTSVHPFCAVAAGCQIAELPLSTSERYNTVTFPQLYLLCPQHTITWDHFWNLLQGDNERATPWDDLVQEAEKLSDKAGDMVGSKQNKGRRDGPQQPMAVQPQLVEPTSDRTTGRYRLLGTIRPHMSRLSAAESPEVVAGMPFAPWTGVLSVCGTDLQMHGRLRQFPVDLASPFFLRPDDVLSLNVVPMTPNHFTGLLLRSAITSYGWVLVQSQPNTAGQARSPSEDIGYMMNLGDFSVSFVTSSYIEHLSELPANLLPWRSSVDPVDQHSLPPSIPLPDFPLTIPMGETVYIAVIFIPHLSLPAPIAPASLISIDKQEKEVELTQELGLTPLPQKWVSPSNSSSVALGAEAFGERTTMNHLAGVVLYECGDIASLLDFSDNYASAVTGQAITELQKRGFIKSSGHELPSRELAAALLSSGPAFVTVDPSCGELPVLLHRPLESFPPSDQELLLVDDSGHICLNDSGNRAKSAESVSRLAVKYYIERPVSRSYGLVSMEAAMAVRMGQIDTVVDGVVLLDAACSIEFQDAAAVAKAAGDAGWTVLTGPAWLAGVGFPDNDVMRLVKGERFEPTRRERYLRTCRGTPLICGSEIPRSHPALLITSTVMYFQKFGLSANIPEDLSELVARFNRYASINAPTEGRARHFLVPWSGASAPIYIGFVTILPLSTLHSLLLIARQANKRSPSY